MEQQYETTTRPTTPGRPMIAFPAAVLAVALCGAVATIAPQPQPHPQRRTVQDPPQPGSQAVHVQVSTAG